MFRSVGLTEDHITSVMDHFLTFREAPEITSTRCFEIAMALYTVMDDGLNPTDLYRPASRYMILLGTRIATWQDQPV